jgi:sec-independent protein translocase protein TatA
MFDIGVPELVIILIIVLVLFGGKKIPELMKNVGLAVKEFKKGLGTDENTTKKRNSSKKKIG